MDSQLPKKFIKEQDKLVNKFLNEDYTSWDEVVEKFGSKEYKDYINKKEKRDQELLKRGIIEN